MTLNQIISDNFEEILNKVNDEILDFRLLKFWKKINPELNIVQLRDSYWTDVKSRAEFSVDLGVEFGKMFELFLPFYLQDKGYDCSPSFNSGGDMIFQGKPYEIKTGQGNDIQGATHSPKEEKPMNLVQVLWEFDKTKNLNELLESKAFIASLNLCVLDDIRINRHGTHSGNNSRTTFKFPKEMHDVIEEAMIFGRCTKGSKNVVFKKTPIAYCI
jgi:hypothetical protein|tara:strand:- start:2384 stop:3028 length:645 start_codon:yes stop_codon:yes gene_type:complete